MKRFRKPIQTTPRQAGKTGLARIHEEEKNGLAGAECSCGWVKVHQRKKVVTRAVDGHVTKKHGGLAIWL
jgi:hypothetical protein